jgi:hypothetical protein
MHDVLTIGGLAGFHQGRLHAQAYELQRDETCLVVVPSTLNLFISTMSLDWSHAAPNEAHSDALML